ncbi:MAG: DUF2381 family protein [Proteobacteria bacterium]|nr:DUF2381 family protein [Pseudomonadota bacterium]
MLAGWSRPADGATCDVSKQLVQTTCAVRVHWRQATTLHFGKPVTDAFALPEGKPFAHIGVTGEFVLLKPRRYTTPPMPTALSVEVGDMVVAVEITFAKTHEAIPPLVTIVDIDLKAHFNALVAAEVERQRQVLDAEYEAKHQALAANRAEMEAHVRNRSVEWVTDAVYRHVTVKPVRGIARTDSGVIVRAEQLLELGARGFVLLTLEHRKKNERTSVGRAALFHDGKQHPVQARLPRSVTTDAPATAVVCIENLAAWRGKALTLRLRIGNEWLDVPLSI